MLRYPEYGSSSLVTLLYPAVQYSFKNTNCSFWYTAPYMCTYFLSIYAPLKTVQHHPALSGNILWLSGMAHDLKIETLNVAYVYLLTKMGSFELLSKQADTDVTNNSILFCQLMRR